MLAMCAGIRLCAALVPSAMAQQTSNPPYLHEKQAGRISVYACPFLRCSAFSSCSGPGQFRSPRARYPSAPEQLVCISIE